MKRIASNLPLGSPRQSIEAELHNADIEFVYQRVDDEFIDSRVVRAGYTASDLSGYVVAYVHGTPKSIIGSCSVLRYFLLGKTGKLIRVLNDQGCVGL